MKRCSPRLAARHSVPAPDSKVSIHHTRKKYTKAALRSTNSRGLLRCDHPTPEGRASLFSHQEALPLGDIMFKCTVKMLQNHLFPPSGSNVLFCFLSVSCCTSVGSGARVCPEPLHRQPSVSITCAAFSEFRKDSRTERETNTARRQLPCSVDICTHTCCSCDC